MIPAARPWAATASFSGAVGLLLCAFASHGAESVEYALWLRLGGFALILHAMVALLALGLVPNGWGRLSAGLFIVGGLVFALSLAAMTQGAPRWFGAITPVGGLLMIAGWLALTWAFMRPLGAGEADQAEG